MIRRLLKRLFDLSFQHKIPLWGAMLIVLSSFSVATILMYRGYHDLRDTLITSSANLGRTLAKTLVPSLLHDDTWRAYEIVRAPFAHESKGNPAQPLAVLVLDKGSEVFVSSDPERYPMLNKLRSFGSEFDQLGSLLAPTRMQDPLVFEPDASTRLFISVPIQDGKARLGTLVLIHSRPALNFVFIRNSLGAALFGLLVLAVLLPINWYWGHRMATPLVRLARRMEQVAEQPPRSLEEESYPYSDELGQLFAAYNRMTAALQEKAALEREMLSSERLAAVGRLTAGIAHEINNPLAGLLTALDTLRQRDSLGEKPLRTVALLERGLLQIKETVAALLVEARSEQRHFNVHDVEDINTLLHNPLKKKQLTLVLDSDFGEEVDLPAIPVRQILLNLLNNAIKATATGEAITLIIKQQNENLTIEVNNPGEPIPEEHLRHLFEPFVSYSQSGHGLGLWVTYQLVQQLGGTIEPRNLDNTVSFRVTFPLTMES